MKTNKWLLRFAVVAILVCLSSSAHAQFREPAVLPNLAWRDATNTVESTMMWQGSLMQDFEFGWNWAGIFGRIGNHLGMRRIHCSDYRYNPEIVGVNNNNDLLSAELKEMQYMLTRDGVDNMQLIPSVRGVGQAEITWVKNASGNGPSTGELGEEQSGSNPSETVAMEFAPWLIPIGTTGHFELRSDDNSGAVFGWKTRNRGTVSNDNGTYRMKYDRLAAGQTASTDPILDNATPDGELRRWEPANSPYHKVHFNNQNTRIMEVAVTLRRTEADPVGSGPDDPVLTIELPYALGKDALGSAKIVFHKAPKVPVTWERFDNVSGVRMAVVTGDLANPQNPTQFVITRQMLPALTDPEREVTLIARFLCDGELQNNKPLRDQMGRTASNDEIGKIGIRVFHNDDPATGLGIELRNIRLQTPEAGKLFTGQHDERVQRNANLFLTHLRTMDMAITGRAASAPPTMRVWMFYGRDEGPKCYWKSYRYLNTLLDRRLMTEAGVEDPDEFRHCVRPRVFWQGAAPATSPWSASYAYLRGYNTIQPETDATRRSFAGIRFGMANMAPVVNGTITTYRDDPDTYLNSDRRTQGPGWSKLPTALPLPETDVDECLKLTNPEPTCGVLSDLEHRLLLDYAPMRGLLFGTEPWLGQVWLNYHMQVQGGNDTTNKPKFATFSNNRPRTLGEARTALWLPVLLGAKGLMLYRNHTSREGSGQPFTPDPLAFATTDKTNADNLENGLLGHFPVGSSGAPVTNDPSNGATNLQTWLEGDDAGTDWMTDTDLTNVPAYFAPSFATVTQNLSHDPVANSAQPKLYAGTRTVRRVSMEVFDKIRNMTSLLGKGESGAAPTDPNILMSLRLEGWYGHGFTTIDVRRNENASASPLSRFIDMQNITSRLRTRHPYRNRQASAPSASSPGHLDHEPHDSSFYDLVIHSLQSDRAMTTSCVIGVLNRRTDPRMLDVPTGTATRLGSFVAASTNAWKFAGYPEWEARGAAGRLDQRGTRRLTLPFALAPGTNNAYRYLRIRELGGGLDTIVGGDRSLDIDLLPGEGRMFRCDVVEADQIADAPGSALTRGYTGVNSQRKMVVFPTQPATPQPVTDRWPYMSGSPGRENTTIPWQRASYGSGGYRYHRVFHRRDVEPNGMLTVYYQRSAPLARLLLGTTTSDGMIDAPSVTWEPEIELSKVIEADGAVGAMSCAYPSLVVRRSPATGLDLVYVVYACSMNVPLQVAICEAVLDANIAGHQQQQNDYTALRRSRRLGLAMAAPQAPCADDHLAYWGTPVINASHLGNYYAWSDYSQNSSIVVGFKRPDERSGEQMAKLRLPVEPGMQAQFPSMPSYSKLHLGEEDCSIVWQQGPKGQCESGTEIIYTRLRGYPTPAGYEFQNGLEFNAVGLPPSGAPLQIRNQGTVACLSCEQQLVGTRNMHPTIYRHLSEFDDNTLTPVNPLFNIGYVNHKAERIMWENQQTYPAAAPGPGFPIRLAYRSVDVTDRSPAAGLPSIWSSSIGFIERSMADLVAPELIQGEQKTELWVDPLSAPDRSARSWRYDDTTLLASFVQKGSGIGSAVTHMTFFDDLFWNVPPGGITTQITENEVRATQLYQGINPHVSARPSVQHMPGLTMNRRIFESGTAIFPQPGYNQAPMIGYTARGFFKESADDEKVDRIFNGYRSNDMEATIGDIRLDGMPIGLVPENVSMRFGRLLPTRYVTDWFELGDQTELTVHTRAEGDSYADAEAFIERRSDGQRLTLPVLAAAGAVAGQISERTHRYSWEVLGDEYEEYRIVMAPIDLEVLPVQDIELAASNATLARAGVLPARGVLDLKAMTAFHDSIPSRLALQAVPSITTGSVTVVISGIQRMQSDDAIDVVDLMGRTLITVPLPYTRATVQTQLVDISGLPAGYYHLRLAGTSAAAGVIRR